jgi:hypothetical protein
MGVGQELQRREFLRLSKPGWNALLEAAVTPLFKEVSQ